MAAVTWEQRTAEWDAMAARAEGREQALRREIRRVLAPLETTIADQQRTIDDLRAQVVSLQERLAWSEHAAAS